MYYHILTSVIGAHSNIQDAIKYFEDNDRIIAVVADGLGSRTMSADGAKLICRLIVRELKTISLPLKSEEISSPKKWYYNLRKKHCKHDDYCTTCSFVVIDKSLKLIGIGQIGDSPVFIGIDDNPVIPFVQQKEFSNITDCLGGKTIRSFKIHNFKYTSHFNVLVSSDGFGDELDHSSMSSLFSYLTAKYKGYSPKSRSRQFTKETKATIGNVNSDDKSAIYIWSE